MLDVYNSIKKKKRKKLLLVILVITIKGKKKKRNTHKPLVNTLYQENRVKPSWIRLWDRILHQDKYDTCPFVFCSYLTQCKIIPLLYKKMEWSWFRSPYRGVWYHHLRRHPAWHPGRYDPIRDPLAARVQVVLTKGSQIPLDIYA